MRAATWIKLLIITLVISFLAVFFVQNRGPASIQFPFGGACHFGLIYVILISYVFGVLTAVLVTFMAVSKRAKKKRSRESESLSDDE